jgi:hypothetical protein
MLSATHKCQATVSTCAVCKTQIPGYSNYACCLSVTQIPDHSILRKSIGCDCEVTMLESCLHSSSLVLLIGITEYHVILSSTVLNYPQHVQIRDVTHSLGCYWLCVVSLIAYLRIKFFEASKSCE